MRGLSTPTISESKKAKAIRDRKKQKKQKKKKKKHNDQATVSTLRLVIQRRKRDNETGFDKQPIVTRESAFQRGEKKIPIPHKRTRNANKELTKGRTQYCQRMENKSIS